MNQSVGHSHEQAAANTAPARKSKRLWLAVVSILVLAVVFGFAAFAWSDRDDTPLPINRDNPLVGVWKYTDSVTKNTTTLTLMSDGKWRTTVADATGAVTSGARGSWRTQDGRFIYEEDGRGSKLSKFVGNLLGDEDWFSINFIGEHELRLGDTYGPEVVYRRVPTTAATNASASSRPTESTFD